MLIRTRASAACRSVEARCHGKRCRRDLGQCGHELCRWSGRYAIGATGTVGQVRDLLREKTPADLEKEGRDLLAVMGVSQGTMTSFYANPNLSPTDKIVIVKVLESLGGIQQRELFVAGAAKAPSIEMGFFYRHQAMLIQQYAKRVSRCVAL